MSPTRSAREISDQITNTGAVHIRLLGPDTRHWCLQKSLLRHHSPYFRAVLSSNTIDETINDLEALHPGILSPIPSASSPSIISTSAAAAAAPFELFVQWIYTGTIDPTPTLANSDVNTDAQQLDIYIRLFCLCAASHLNVPKLVSLAVTRMYELYHICQCREKNSAAFFFTAAHVQYIYTHTPPQSRLRDIALRASVYDYLNSTSAATTTVAAMCVSAETSVHDDDDDGNDNHSNVEDNRGRRGEEKDNPFDYPHQPSYAYMDLSLTFSNDLLHAFRTHVLSSVPNVADSFKHPLQIRQDLAPQFPSPSSSLTETPPPPPQKIRNRTKNNEDQDGESDRDRDGEVKLSVPIKGLLTPDATPTKKSGKSVSDMVRTRSLEKWVHDDNANATTTATATTDIIGAGDLRSVFFDASANATEAEDVTLSKTHSTETPIPIPVAIPIAGESGGDTAQNGKKYTASASTSAPAPIPTSIPTSELKNVRKTSSAPMPTPTPTPMLGSAVSKVVREEGREEEGKEEVIEVVMEEEIL